MSKRSALVRQLRCIACAQEGIREPDQCGRTEEHHCNEQELAGHKRVGDHASIPLGAWHHRGIVKPGWTIDQMTHVYGPSLVHDQKQFRAAYGKDGPMIEVTDNNLERLLPATA